MTSSSGTSPVGSAADPPPEFDPDEVKRDAAIASSLEAWFTSAARDLPWRRHRTGWTALVSEAMLQQTQVSRVIPIYERFMTRFPSPAALAAASEDDVLSMWQGLGYYRRARMLRNAAKVIVDSYDGNVPTDAANLRTLPGVGRYTAGAIASIAFGERTPIVDGNVTRVIARLDADVRPPQSTDAIKQCWTRSESLVNVATRPAVFNEAMMELGATICTPGGHPACDICPVRSHCRARVTNQQGEIPPAAKSTKRTIVHYHTILVARGELLLVEQRPERGLWASMWQPPTIESDTRLSFEQVADRIPIRLTDVTARGSLTHITTHREVRFHVATARTRSRQGRWISESELNEVAIGNGHRKAMALRHSAPELFA